MDGRHGSATPRRPACRLRSTRRRAGSPEQPRTDDSLNRGEIEEQRSANLDRSRTMENRKSYHVVWLAHLVGDLHQPMHAVARLSAATPNGDKGGGEVFVNCSGCDGVLHAFWKHSWAP
ncbi:S1/P1 nuclease [Phenylobacterium sp. VNQ135]|uniref:S1/P1 nuclease n=1 Tax=Phenylobacterium sp. VNQ135 TaxID=3400922 RepID=UPI003C095FEE